MRMAFSSQSEDERTTYFLELPRDPVDIANLRRIPDRHHIRSYPHELPIFFMQCNVDFMSASTPHPIESRDIRPRRQKRPRHTAQLEVRMQKRDDKNDHQGG